MPARRIHDNHIESFLLELGHTLGGDRHRVCFGVGTEVGDFGFGCGLSRLVECAGAERVGADDGGFEPAALVVDCELEGGEGDVSRGVRVRGVWRYIYLCTRRSFSVPLVEALKVSVLPGSRIKWEAYIPVDRQP